MNIDEFLTRLEQYTRQQNILWFLDEFGCIRSCVNNNPYDRHVCPITSQSTGTLYICDLERAGDELGLSRIDTNSIARAADNITVTAEDNNLRDRILKACFRNL